MEEDRPKPIEIELTPTEPDRGRGRPDQEHAAVESEPTDEAPIAPTGSSGSPGPFETERGRLITVAAVVGVVALLFGWMVGRAGGTDEAADTPSATSSPDLDELEELDEPEASIATILPGEEIDAPETIPPTTVARQQVTTTTVPLAGEPVIVTPFGVTGPFVGMPIEIVGLQRTGTVVRLDLSAPSLTTTETSMRNIDSPAELVVGDDWILLPSWQDFGDGSPLSLLLVDGEAPREVDVGVGWQLLHRPGEDTLWQRTEAFAGSAALTEVSYDGVPTGRVIEMPTSAISIDPGGGFLASVPGGIYHIDDTETEQISTGRVVAVGADVLLAEECDAELECGYVVVDRESGDRRMLGTSDDEPVRFESTNWWGTDDAAGVSPDGGFAAVLVFEEFGSGGSFRQHLGLLDLATGDVTELTESFESPAVWWSPDSRYALYLDNRELTAHDTTTGESIVVSPDLGSLDTFVVRPAPHGD